MLILFNISHLISTETEEGIAQAVVKSVVDFERDPWPRVSNEAKDLVRNMLDPNPYNRLTVQEVLGNLCFVLLLFIFFFRSR